MHLVSMTRLRRRGVGLAAGAIGLAVVGPLLRPGFVLAYDMAFVPRPRLSASLLGLSTALPRSVPSGLPVALLSRVIPGQVVEKAIVLAIFSGAAYGAARLVPAGHVAARVAAGVLYAWNPFTYERLRLGQWALLLGYAAIPWVAQAAIRFRRGERGAGSRVVLALFAAAIPSPYTGVIGAILAAVLALAPSRVPGHPGALPGRRERPSLHRAAWVVGAALATNLPWLVPGLVHPAVPQRPGLGLELFRARADSPVGLAGSLLSLGGLWRTDLAPPGRHTVAWIPAFVLIAALAVVGWRALRTSWQTGVRWGLLAVATVGLVLAAAPSLPALDAMARWMANRGTAGGLFRDSQKFVIPLALVEAIGFGMGVDRVLDELRADALGRWAALCLPILPLALAPTLAWGAGGRLSTATYPPSWNRAEAIMLADPGRGAILVLPWHAYLPFGWNHGQTVHQPASQYFSRRAVVSTVLEVGRARLPAEDPWSRLAAPAATGRVPLRSALPGLGVRYVLLFKEADWQAAEGLLGELTPLLETPDLALYRGPPAGPPPRFDTPPAAPVIAGDAVALIVLVAALLMTMAGGRTKPGPDSRRQMVASA